MTQTYFPFDSGQGANATEAMWSKMAQHWLATGVIRDVLNDLSVYANSAGMTVRVKSGAAWLKGHYFESDAEEVLSIATADMTNPRIDRVVVRLDWTANTVQLAVLQGTPAVSPATPALTQNSSRWEISLAQIYVGTSVTSISAMSVTDERFFVKNSNYIIDSSGGIKINASSLSDDILAILLSYGKGIHTFYNISGATNNPAFFASIRGMAHLTSSNSGWVFAIDTNNNMYTNYCDLGTWKGWAKLTNDKTASWANLTIQNTTVNNGRTPRYSKVGNLVSIIGEISMVADNTVIATLPALYRPATHALNFLVPVASSVAMQTALISVGIDGKMILITKTSGATSGIVLNGISFFIDS
ncbi:hypothetical protein [Gottfriedia acidiceleris]|uniref:hypothetical protein n=1 Tax=Gottfriedia acidiceleris TaxID=371036 RepID=UPI00101BC810|nr:hypothetical protein [Gottfriedia acidiceleris]